MEIIGSIGAAVIVVFFILNQLHKINQDAPLYDVANALGSLLLFVYAFSLDSIPFMIINGLWFVFSARDVVSVFLPKKKSRQDLSRAEIVNLDENSR